MAVLHSLINRLGKGRGKKEKKIITTRGIKVKNDHMNYFIYTSHHFTPHGRYELNNLASLPMCGFIAQLVEHRTGIAEVTGSNPVEALIFSGFFFPVAQIGKFTAMIILHFDLQPQFKHMNYFIYTSHHTGYSYLVIHPSTNLA